MSPRAAGSLFFGANGRHAVMPAGCLLFLRSPIRDAVENRGEKTPVVLDVHFPMCVMFGELPPTNLCVFAASGRRRASRFARSTKHRPKLK